MSLTKRSKHLRNWFLSFIICILACGFSVWGIRELLFPPTDVCAIERTEGKNLLDVSQIYPVKNNIELIGHVGGKATSVFVDGNIAFVKLGLELAAFDVRDPANPKRIGYILIPGELIQIDDKRRVAYIHSQGLWKVDVSDPTQMSAVQVYNPKYHITSIKLLGEQAYITTRKCEYISFFEGSIQTRCDNTIHIVDAANPNVPNQCYQGIQGKAISALVTMNAPELIIAPETAQQGKYVYATEEKEGFKIYEGLNPVKLVEIGSYPSTSEFTEVIVYGTHVWATSLECKNQETHYCLRLFDGANPTDPKDLGELPYKPVIVTEFNHYAVLREQFGYDNWPPGVEILDMSLPVSNNASLTPNQMAEIVNMTVVDNRAYATTRDNNFLILDISNIKNPIVVASYSLGRHDQLNYGISMSNNYVYIIVRNMGMRILDISDEKNIIEVGEYKMETIPVELIVKDHYAYIAEWYGNLEIVDVSDPEQPTQVGIYSAGDRINKIHIVNNYLFMTTGSSGLQIIDISNPTIPSLVGSFITGTFVTGVDVDCQYIYLSDIENGLFILRSKLIPTNYCD